MERETRTIRIFRLSPGLREQVAVGKVNDYPTIYGCDADLGGDVYHAITMSLCDYWDTGEGSVTIERDEDHPDERYEWELE